MQVTPVSDLATQREIHEFFSFTGQIDYIDIRKYIYIVYFISSC